MSDAVLSVKDLVVEYKTPGGTLRAVDGVSLDVYPGETVAVVGESGCGKTTLARAILGPQTYVEGSITIQGQPVNGATRDQASRVGMVWQDPFASIDPQWTIRRIVGEAGVLSKRQVDLNKLLESVGLSAELAERYPHQLSGGQRQRAAIARALALHPPLVICDEPTAALDLSIQAQILNLLKDIQDNQKCSFLYISHDLLTVRYLAHRVAVMYRGQFVETGTAQEVFENPKNEYTKALLDSAPSLEKLGLLPETESI